MTESHKVHGIDSSHTNI